LGREASAWRERPRLPQPLCIVFAPSLGHDPRSPWQGHVVVFANSTMYETGSAPGPRRGISRSAAARVAASPDDTVQHRRPVC